MVLRKAYSLMFRLLLTNFIILIAVHNYDKSIIVSKSNFVTKTLEKIRLDYKFNHFDILGSFTKQIIFAEGILLGLSGLSLLFLPKLSRTLFFLALIINFSLFNNYFLYRNNSILKNMSYMLTIFGGTFL
jgi:hypothetical protein